MANYRKLKVIHTERYREYEIRVNKGDNVFNRPENLTAEIWNEQGNQVRYIDGGKDLEATLRATRSAIDDIFTKRDVEALHEWLTV